MKRTRTSRTSRATPDFEQLIQLAQGLGLSCCRIEDAHWEARLAPLIDQILKEGDESTLSTALEHLFNKKAADRAYNALAEMIESRCEIRTHASSSLLLFNAPLLAWSRYGIPCGTLSASIMANLRVHLQAHVFAEGVKIALADYLYSPDQLPQGYCQTAELTDRLGACAAHNRDLSIETEQMPETTQFLSDTRHLVGVALINPGAPLFRWQEEDAQNNHNRDHVLQQWSSQAGEALRPMLTGCASELLLPLSYHAACRMSDRLSRSYSLRASVAFLNATLNIQADALCATIAPFYEQELTEYRVGFSLKDSNQVIHGVVWPLLDEEDSNMDTPAYIETLLREVGVKQILQIDHRLPVEYCDDCGSPLYPNPEGEPMHAELPEDQTETTPRHLH